MGDVEELRESLVTYQDQMRALEEAESAAAEGPAKEELRSLLSELGELAELTRGQLEDLEAAGLGPSSSAASLGAGSAEAEEEEETVEEALRELRATLSGLRCRAPWSGAAGAAAGLAHNAIVLEVEEAGWEGRAAADLASLPVRVLFSNPLQASMRPCPHFLASSCTFGPRCKFSHGHALRFDQLLEYQEPDFGVMDEGSRCLVRRDELWALATVTSVCSAEAKCAVKIQATGKEEAVGFGDLVPVELGGSGAEEEEAFPSAGPVESATTQWGGALHKPWGPLGGWEAHTRGFGSRLMAQMGYVAGEGLGKASDGIVNPVKATKLPKGKSLDAVMEAREAREADPDKALRVRRRKARREKLKKARLAEGGLRSALESGVFDFLNHRLAAKPSKAQEERRKADAGRKLKQTSSKSLGVALLEAESSERRATAEMAKQREILQRNKTKNPAVAAQAQRRLDELEAKVRSVRSHASSIDSEQSKRRDAKKLAIF